MKLDAIAIELDLVNLVLANGHPVYGRRQSRFNEAEIIGFDVLRAFYAEPP
jgi:hypothetical protein